MAPNRVSGKNAVDDYFSSLLLDTQIEATDDEQSEPVLRFARVEPGFEVLSFWTGPLSGAQQLCSDLIILSCLSQITGNHLRRAMLASISAMSRL